MTTNNALNITGEGLQIFDPSDGSFTPIDLTTKGDLLVYDGSAYQRIGVGSNDQVLTADSGESTGLKWATNAAGAGAWTFLSETVASSDANIQITSNLDSTYSAYMFHLEGVHPSADGSFYMKVSTDGGSSYANTNYQNSGTGDTSGIFLGSYGAAASEGVEGFLYLLSFNNSSEQTKVLVDLAGLSASNSLVNEDEVGIRKVAEANDALVFFFPAGLVDSGTFRLYGLSES